MILPVVAIIAYVSIGLLATILVVGRIRRHASAVLGSMPVSVIVAVRDEEPNLPMCLQALGAQQFGEDVEYIIVDDDSSDRTREIAEEAVRIDSRFRLVSAGEVSGMSAGKARAVHAGILAAQHDLLIVTDADCRPPGEWLAAMASRFSDPQLGILGGVTEVRSRGVLGLIQTVDWWLLLGVASGWSLAGRPLTAMGNNMAFRRSAYVAVGGYPGLPECVTEDYALFYAIARRTDFRSVLDPSFDLRNVTEPAPSLPAIFAQRKRWARGAMAASPVAVLFYVIVLAAHALPLFILPTHPTIALTLIAGKIMTDLIVAAAMIRGRDLPRLAGGFLPYQVWLYAYVLTLPIVLAVQPDIRWKGRVYRSQRSSPTGS